MVPTQALSPTQAIDCNPDAVSAPALELFRLVERLSRRSGFACVRLLANLARMHGRCERATRYALAELLEAGWIQREHTRAKGRSLLTLRPLVKVAGRVRGVFSPSRIAGRVAGCSGEELQDAPPSPLKKTPVGTGDDNTASGPVVVCDPPDPGILAQAQAAVKAYAERHPVRSRGALLAAAIKGRWQPPAPVSEHPSDRNERAVRLVTAPPGWQLGASRAGNAPPGAQEPRRAVPGLSPVSVSVSSSAVSSPGLVAILARCQARRRAA